MSEKLENFSVKISPFEPSDYQDNIMASYGFYFYSSWGLNIKAELVADELALFYLTECLYEVEREYKETESIFVCKRCKVEQIVSSGTAFQNTRDSVLDSWVSASVNNHFEKVMVSEQVKAFMQKVENDLSKIITLSPFESLTVVADERKRADSFMEKFNGSLWNGLL